MNQDQLIKNLDHVQELTKSSRTARILSRPWKYAVGIGFRRLIFPFTKHGVEKRAKTFFGVPVSILLPGSMDLYLFGTKTHESELRLARFLIKHGDQCRMFLDIGAHAGYFTLLVNKIVELQDISSRIFAFEPSVRNFNLLQKNAGKFPNIRLMNIALSDSDQNIPYYQFSDLYSEYNSLIEDQYVNESWYRSTAVDKMEVQGIMLDTLIEKENIVPTLIKIDVEGAEAKVILGGKQTLTQFSPMVIMEFLSDEKKNSAHLQAHQIMLSYGYTCFTIDENGSLKLCPDPMQEMMNASKDSDNLVYQKKVNQD